MKILVAVLVLLVAGLGAMLMIKSKPAPAAAYSTEATITRQAEKNTYEVAARIAKTVTCAGKVAEVVLSQPRCVAAPGVPASLYAGANPQDPDYARKENINLEVSWPDAGQPGFATCAVTIKLGDRVIAKNLTKVSVNER